MKMNKFVLVFALLLIIPLASAQIGIPHQFYGDVSYNSAPASNGIAVVAKIDGVVVKQTTTFDGKYGYNPLFLITDPDETRRGKTIFFYVNNIEAGSSIFENGMTTELNLAVSGSETSPTTPGGSGGGGGGGGGGGTPTTNLTNNQTSGGSNPETSSNNEGINQGNTNNGFFPGITGAVIGFLSSGSGIVVIIFIATVAIGAGIVIYRKRKGF